jgi:hypothetical protein
VKLYNLRNLEPRDMAQLIELNEIQNSRDGTHYPLPRMFGERGNFDPDIALALAVDRGKQLAQGVYFQSRIVEMCFAGCDPRATAYVRREATAVRFTLRGMGYKGVRCLIPHLRVPQLEPALFAAGFVRTDARFASFYFDLEGTPR